MVSTDHCDVDVPIGPCAILNEAKNLAVAMGWGASLALSMTGKHTNRVNLSAAKSLSSRYQGMFR
ncbi:MAG: hypothetical protein KatS3mg023_1503 [Armatimonadota bacterium]|nr:MAG: hypothetical protein KatS3mg023_1503 [Armatimonadota bacterium]